MLKWSKNLASMSVKIVFMAVLFALLTTLNVKAEAVETFGVMDIRSRVPVTNVNHEIVTTFPNARQEMLADFDTFLVIPGKVEMIDLGSEFEMAALDEQAIMQQMGSSNINPKLKECNYIIYMYLTNCNEVITDKVIEKHNAIKVDLSARIIDTKTSKCVFVATGYGIAKARDYRALGMFRFKTFACPEEQFYIALQDAVRQIALKIKEKM